MRNTNFSRTLQEDASCQMLTVLRRYIHMMGTNCVEQAVVSDTIPQLITIQKGILALTRQWKNVLYMPQLSQFSNFKTKKHRPYTVSVHVAPDENQDDDGASVNMDVVDERASLLDGGSINGETISMISGHGVPDPKKKPGGDSRYLQIQRALFNSPKRQETNPHMTSLLRNESVQSIHSVGGASVADDIVAPTPPATPYKVSTCTIFNLNKLTLPCVVR